MENMESVTYNFTDQDLEFDYWEGPILIPANSFEFSGINEDGIEKRLEAMYRDLYEKNIVASVAFFEELHNYRYAKEFWTILADLDDLKMTDKEIDFANLASDRLEDEISRLAGEIDEDDVIFHIGSGIQIVGKKVTFIDYEDIPVVRELNQAIHDLWERYEEAL